MPLIFPISNAKQLNCSITGFLEKGMHNLLKYLLKKIYCTIFTIKLQSSTMPSGYLYFANTVMFLNFSQIRKKKKRKTSYT